MTVLCDLSGIIRFVSPLCPAGRPDITQLREMIPNLEQQLDPRDVLLFDKAYIGVEKDFDQNVIHVKYKKPQKAFLPEQLKIENSEMEKIRRHIESAFGDIKNRFSVLEKKFRHDRQLLTPIAHFCTSLCNEIKRYYSDEAHYSSEWKGPIPDIETSNQIKRKVLFLYLTIRKLKFGDIDKNS
jgi:hypothetical protein